MLQGGLGIVAVMTAAALTCSTAARLSALVQKALQAWVCMQAVKDAGLHMHTLTT